MPLLRPGPYRGSTGISVHATDIPDIAKRFAMSSSILSSPLRKFQETGATLTRMDAHDEHCQSPTTPPAGVNVSDHNRLHEGGLRAYSGAFAHCAAPWSPMAFATE